MQSTNINNEDSNSFTYSHADTKRGEDVHSSQSENRDNDDDEEVLGVVAAEGLGGALKI
jgi:hypothetical protein